jgi:hypothetical protein
MPVDIITSATSAFSASKEQPEFLQITIGGRADEQAELGALIGPAVRDDVADAGTWSRPS